MRKSPPLLVLAAAVGALLALACSGESDEVDPTTAASASSTATPAADRRPSVTPSVVATTRPTTAGAASPGAPTEAPSPTPSPSAAATAPAATPTSPPPTGTPAPPTPTPTPVVEAPATASVAIIDNAFSPFAVTIRAGGTVTWTHQGAQFHNVNGDGFDSPITNVVGTTFSHTFAAPGTYEYRCDVHQVPPMTGRVVVR